MDTELMGFDLADRPRTGILISAALGALISFVAYILLESLGNGPHGLAMSFIIFGPVAVALVSAAALFIAQVRRAALGALITAFGIAGVWLVVLVSLGIFGRAL